MTLLLESCILQSVCRDRDNPKALINALARISFFKFCYITKIMRAQQAAPVVLACFCFLHLKRVELCCSFVLSFSNVKPLCTFMAPWKKWLWFNNVSLTLFRVNDWTGVHLFQSHLKSLQVYFTPHWNKCNQSKPDKIKDWMCYWSYA